MGQQRHKYYEWDITKGDYQIDYESTRTYEILMRRKRKINKIVKLASAVVVIAISVFVIYISI